MPEVDLCEETERLVREYAARPGVQLTRLELSGSDPWSVVCSFQLNHDEEFLIRSLFEDDMTLLKSFGRRLGPESQNYFCPYPWDDEAWLAKSLENAIRQSLRRVDLSFLMFCDGLPVGHFFLWKAGGNTHSGAYGVQVPELGVAIADAFQHRGLGALAVRLLLRMGRRLSADAIELTTALDNSTGLNTYTRIGFESVGIIRNPLEVDVTSAALGEVQATRFRAERQMVYLLEPSRGGQVMQYLAVKRAESG